MLSNKLMTMKFMTASNARADELNAGEQNKRNSEAHWRLAFKDAKTNTSGRATEVVSSYAAFSGSARGRRRFGRNLVEEEVDTSPEAQATDHTEEAPQDRHARRQAEKELDARNLRGLQGMTSLSESSPNAKRKQPSSQRISKSKKSKTK